MPALLGLKGNLEMTLASRLSTIANLGQMDSRSQQINALISNVALVQAQAIIVSLAASILTLITSIVEGQQFVWNHFVSLTLIAILTASAASLILSTTMVMLAILCRKCNMNPGIVRLESILTEFRQHLHSNRRRLRRRDHLGISC